MKKCEKKQTNKQAIQPWKSKENEGRFLGKTRMHIIEFWVCSLAYAGFNI